MSERAATASDTSRPGVESLMLATQAAMARRPTCPVPPGTREQQRHPGVVPMSKGFMPRGLMARARILAVLLALLCGAMLTPTHGMAQTTRAEPAPTVVLVPQVGLAEAALASCAGGAMIGYLLVVATGPGSPTATAALFCGLSAAATVTSSVTFWAWRSVTGWLP